MFKLRVSVWIEPENNNGTTAYGSMHINQSVDVKLAGFAEVGNAIEQFHRLAESLGQTE